LLTQELNRECGRVEEKLLCLFLVKHAVKALTIDLLAAMYEKEL